MRLSARLIELLTGVGGVWLFFPAAAYAQELSLKGEDFLISQGAHLLLILALLYLFYHYRKLAGEERSRCYFCLGLLLLAFWSGEHILEKLLFKSLLPPEMYFNGDLLLVGDIKSAFYLMIKATRTLSRLGGIILILLGLREMRRKHMAAKDV